MNKTLSIILTTAILTIAHSHCLAETLWVDVRSLLEHKIDHIEGDPRIPHTEIVEGMAKLTSDKNAEIQLYCRSGGRAETAKQALLSAGYKNVKNAGGIGDARKLRTPSASEP